MCSYSQVITICESKFYLDPVVIKDHQFKVVEFYVHEYFYVIPKSSEEHERKTYDKFRLRFFMNNSGFPDSVYYFGDMRKNDRHWSKAWINDYFEFLPDSLRSRGKAKSIYNENGLISREELITNDFHDCCNPKVSVSKYSYNSEGKIISIEHIRRNSTPSRLVDSTRYEFTFMKGKQEVRRTTLREKSNSRLVCVDDVDSVQKLVVIDRSINDVLLRIQVTYQK